MPPCLNKICHKFKPRMLLLLQCEDQARNSQQTPLNRIFKPKLQALRLLLNLLQRNSLPILLNRIYNSKPNLLHSKSPRRRQLRKLLLPQQRHQLHLSLLLLLQHKHKLHRLHQRHPSQDKPRFRLEELTLQRI